MSSFGPIASHYDVLMANVPYDMWAGYYQLLMTQMEQEPERLLDVCCGTGTVAELLAQSDYQVTGFDLSAPMIEVARQKEAENGYGIEYFVQDAAELNLGKTFDGAYSFFDSLNYICELERFNMAIKRVARHIEPGGSFVFDMNTAYAFENKMFDQQDLRKRALIKYDWKGEYDPATRLIKVDMKFWRDGEEIRETHVQRAHSEDEISDALQAAGFSWVRAYDSYTLDPPNKKSDRVHYVAVMPR